MVKLIGAVMTGFACGYFGFRLRMTLKTRMVSLANIVTSLETLESEINFSVNKLKKALVRADTNGLFALAAEKTDALGAEKAWSEAVREMSGKLCLTGADCDALNLLGRSLGKTDRGDQIKNIRYVKSLADAQRRAAETEYAKYGKLYSSGGVLVGAFIVIALM